MPNVVGGTVRYDVGIYLGVGGILRSCPDMLQVILHKFPTRLSITLQTIFPTLPVVLGQRQLFWPLLLPHWILLPTVFSFQLSLTGVMSPGAASFISLRSAVAHSLDGTLLWSLDRNDMCSCPLLVFVGSTTSLSPRNTVRVAQLTHKLL